MSSVRPPLPAVAFIAAEFSRQLVAVIGADKVAQVVALNVVEPSAGVCHSHDFCDANMVMQTAFGNLGLSTDQAGTMTEEHVHLWNLAWDAARASMFALPAIHAR